ncbi:MAG: SDR family oxidoreductase [Desulfovibrio sp.]|nr:SDR family oxidoreductase [Desulfovibrio sp.]
MAQKLLITGADGFIGSHLAEFCVQKGYDVRAFCLYNSFGRLGWLDSSPLLPEMDVFCGDIRDAYGVRQAMRGCDAVLHLAALIAIPYSYHSPETYVDTNIKGTLNVVQAARDLDVSRVVHTSTSEVYGTARFVPITEEHPLQGQSPYSATKIGADQLALSFHKAFGTPVAVLRPFNTYGPRQSTRAVIPTIITQLAAGMREIRLGSLHPTRDFSYVTDTAAAFEAVLRSDDCVGEVVNGGSGFEISIGDLARDIAELMSADIEIRYDDARLRPADSEVERLWADNSKLKRLTTWRPLFEGREGFRRGLRETIDWFSRPENLRLYKPGRYIL